LRIECNIADTVAPVIECVDITFQLDYEGQYTLDASELLINSYDVCGIDSLILSKSDFNCDDIGIVLIELTAKDQSNNSTTCIAEASVYGNIAPVAVNDTVFMVQNTTIDIDVAANDYDTKTNVVSSTVSAFYGPEFGEAKIDTMTGIIYYTPPEDFIGVDHLVYSICDDGIPCVPMCNEAAVVIYVLEPNIPPVAQDDNYETMCYMLSGNILINDYDPDSYEYSINTSPINDKCLFKVAYDSINFLSSSK